MRAIIYALVFYPGTLLFVIGCWIGSLFGPRQMRAVVHAWTDFNHRLASLLGTRVEVQGAIPPGPYLIAVKHQSMFETLEMVRVAKAPIMVLKRELSQIPGFCRAKRSYGVIPVERDAGAKALREMLDEGKRSVATGRPIIIYPECTRVRPGEMPPLQ